MGLSHTYILIFLRAFSQKLQGYSKFLVPQKCTLFFSRIDVDIVNVLSEKLAFRYYAKNQKKHPQKILYALEHLSCQ